MYSTLLWILAIYVCIKISLWFLLLIDIRDTYVPAYNPIYRGEERSRVGQGRLGGGGYLDTPQVDAPPIELASKYLGSMRS